MKVETIRFGTLEVDKKSVLKMPKGPVGFEERTEYILLQHRPDTNFRWLQCIDDPSLAFVVADPSQYFSGYEIELSDADAEALRLTSDEDALALVIVSVGEGGKEITANLIAPIIVNTRELVAMQVVLQDSRYSVKHALAEQVDKKSRKSKENAALEAA